MSARNSWIALFSLEVSCCPRWKYIGVSFLSDGKSTRWTGGWCGISCTAGIVPDHLGEEGGDLPVELLYFPNLMTERMRLQIQAAEMTEFIRRSVVPGQLGVVPLVLQAKRSQWR